MRCFMRHILPESPSTTSAPYPAQGTIHPVPLRKERRASEVQIGWREGISRS